MNRRLTPIVYIAFGDPENVPGAELPALKREEANICAALSNVCELGSWEVVSGRNCTRADLVKTFDSDRVAVFHFGGHASPQSLLLPAEEKGSQIVNGMLLEDFLARQANLKLAFFNACSTERWARKLSESIPYVVATVCAVDDGKALDFASAFYAALAADNTIEEAFSRASGAVVLQHEELKPVAQQAETDAVLGRTEFRRMDTNDEDATGVPPFPWILCRNGRAAADDTKWSFSVAAHDPLIGLPLLSPADYVLPERPYVTIKGHTEADAPLFFGRNAEIRALYDWALKNDGPPVLLFHGQSGAGKSSLLNAGLLPRLKKKQSVTYRKRGVNLVEDLHAAIGGGSDADISAWLDSPAPNLVILDQVEEAITHNAGSPDEMQAFVARVKEVFARRQPGSKARLLLSFRKEYLAEIQGLFAKGEGEGIGSLVETFWLDRLDTEGIVDVVEGPTRTPALAEKYKIALEDGFAEFVASRLNDPNSPIATILQIVLNQLWDKAKDRGGDPVYTRELWGSLSALDNPLHGFYGDQLERLFAEGGEAYRNGLELDMLLEHTTELGTSQRRTLMELEKFYPQLEPAVLAQLIQRNKDLYLLVDPPAQEGDGAAATVLAHDTLAPVIRRDHALSVNEGARARRLVENRSREWVDGKRGEPLDALDLRVVRLGLKNMRALNGDEQRMLTFSRKRARRNFGIAAAVLAGIAAIGGGIALYERAQEEAQARTKDAIRLASEAKAEASNDYDLAVLLSIAAFKTDPTRFEVRDAITSVYEARPEAIAFLHPKKPMTYIDGGMVFSQDSKLLAAENGNQLELWDVQQKKRLWTVQTVPDATESFGSILFSKDNKWMVLADETQGTQVRDVTTGALRQGGLPNVSKHLEAVSIGKSILVAGGACNLQAWFVDGWSGGVSIALEKQNGCTAGYNMTNLAINPRDDSEMAIRWLDGKVTVASRILQQADDAVNPNEQRDEGNYILAYSGDGKRLVATTRFGDLAVFDVETGRSMGVLPAQGDVRFTGAALNQDGSRLTAFRGGELGEWDTRGMQPVRQERTGWAGLNNAVVSPDFGLVALRGRDGDVVLLDNAWGAGGVPDPDPDPAAPQGNTLPVEFSPDGKWIATGTEDGGVFVWDAATRKMVTRVSTGSGERHHYMVGGLAFSRDSTELVWHSPVAISDENLGLRAVRVPGGQFLPDLAVPQQKGEDSIEAAAIAPDGTLVGVSDAGVIRIWDMHSGTVKELKGRVGSSAMFGISISPDGKMLAAPGMGDAVVGLFSLVDGQPVQPPIGAQGMKEESVDLHAAAGGSKGMLLAEGHPYGISVWDLSSGKSIGSADLGETVPRGVKFSPDGRLLAVGMDGAVRLWDVAAGRWIGGDLMHSGDSLMAHVAFSPDGKRIAWSGDHGAVGAWDWNLNPDKWVEPGCALAGRNMTPQEWNKHYPNKKYQKLCPQFP